MRIAEIVVFFIYLLFMLAIGLFFFFKEQNGSEKTFFLGNRSMGAWVGALSAGASDMSAWVLMGLPTAIYANGIGEVWISLGLAIGYAISWLVEAPRLRRFSIVANDSITIPQYLSNRFLSKTLLLQVLCALVFLVAYTIYTASSLKACGILFNKVTGLNQTTAMYIAVIIIVGYTFFGGFSAVCWTDFFQGLLILGAMLIAPIFAAFMLEFQENASIANTGAAYWNAFANPKQIISGLAWGLGYFGMPHIIIRFMSLKSQKELKKSALIGISWTTLIVLFAALIGIVGRVSFGLQQEIVDNESVFVQMVRTLFPSVISGILLSAVLAASMSTADSQLLSSSSAFASDVYKPLIRRNQASQKELIWVGRFVVLAVALAAFVLAASPKASTIMSLVSNAWGVFGAAFGPAILLSLFWKRFNLAGAAAGILGGAAVDILWLIYASRCPFCNGIYELAPGFIAGLICAVIGTLVTPKPSAAVEKLYDDAVSYRD